MKVTFVSILMCLGIANAFAQQPQIVEIPNAPKIEIPEITARYDVTGHSLNDAGALKDDLLQFHGKVTLVDLDEKQLILKIKYNELMLEEDLVKVFKKHNFDFHSKL